MRYDPRCWDLAEAFLSDYADLAPEERKRETDALAQCIQATIEGYLSHLDPEEEMCDGVLGVPVLNPRCVTPTFP